MPKFAGFDFLRAIFSIAIVADHTGLFTLATVQGSSIVTNLLYANFSYIAVPVFLQISLFLFYLKSARGSLGTIFKRRISRLVYLYLIWVSSFVLLRIFCQEGSAGITKLANLSERGWLEFIISGGNSPFYFFFSLIFVTTLAAGLTWVFKKIDKLLIRTRISYWLLFFSCAIVFFGSTIDLLPLDIDADARLNALVRMTINIMQWNYNPLNFLPYIFTAAIVAQEVDRGKLAQMTPSLHLKLWSLFFLFLIFTLLEWSLLDRLMHYSRLSLVFGSWLLLDLALLSTRKVPNLVRLISEYSLGLYTLHLLFTHIIWAGNSNFPTGLPGSIPGLGIVVEFLIAIGGAAILTFLFKQIGGLKSLV
jgi:hypothetical protein